MRLYEIRAALHVLAGDIESRGLEAEARKLHTLADETKRRPAVRRAPAQAHRSWSLHEIGAACGVNQGRVSEVLAGCRR